jgi:hypothetical protein
MSSEMFSEMLEHLQHITAKEWKPRVVKEKHGDVQNFGVIPD